jgi:hypothetical protein
MSLSFKFTNAAGGSAFVRYRLVPRAGEHDLTVEGVTTKGPNYLVTEMKQRLATMPVVFDWHAEVAEHRDRWIVDHQCRGDRSAMGSQSATPTVQTSAMEWRALIGPA